MEHHNSKKLISAIAAAVVIGVLIMVYFIFGDQGSKVKDEVIAMNNGHRIYRDDINGRFKEILMLQAIGDEVDRDMDYVSQMDKETLTQVVKEAEINKELVKQAKKNGIYKDKKFQQRLDSYRKNLAVEMLTRKKAEEMITDAKIKARYDSIIEYIGDKEEIHVQHILVNSRQAANSVRKELRWRKFEDVAFQRSLDKNSADLGGDLGYVMFENLNKDFANAAFALQVGEISAPVETEYGWHVIKVLDRRKVETYSFDEVKEQIRKQLIKEAMAHYLETISNGIDIKIVYNHTADTNTSNQLKDMLENAETAEPNSDAEIVLPAAKDKENRISKVPTTKQ